MAWSWKALGFPNCAPKDSSTFANLAGTRKVYATVRATTVFLNGNNVRVAGDLVLRTLECRLDAKSEEPETRVFAFDPMATVRKDRGTYLGAIFTIVRAFLADNASKSTPEGMHSVAGFEAWSRLIQQSLMWLGMADPFGNIT